MKFAIIYLFAIAAAAMGEKYTDKYDGINYEEIIKNHRLLVGYVNCMIDEAPCTAEGKELKLHIPDALQTGCTKCTDIQKEGSKVVISHMINFEPELWEKLTAKFDSNGTFARKYEKEYKQFKA